MLQEDIASKAPSFKYLEGRTVYDESVPEIKYFIFHLQFCLKYISFQLILWYKSWKTGTMEPEETTVSRQWHATVINCWKRYLLCGPCQGLIHQENVVRPLYVISLQNNASCTFQEDQCYIWHIYLITVLAVPFYKFLERSESYNVTENRKGSKIPWGYWSHGLGAR